MKAMWNQFAYDSWIVDLDPGDDLTLFEDFDETFESFIEDELIQQELDGHDFFDEDRIADVAAFVLGPPCSSSDSPSTFDSLLAAQSAEEEPKLCQVCGDEAGRFNFYGGQACGSCRAFFRRAAQGGKFESFRCSKKKRCDIDSRSWMSCQWCRFQKCLGCGMRVEWVLGDAQRKAREKRRLEGGNRESQVVVSDVLMPKNRTDMFTLGDEVHLTEFRPAAERAGFYFPSVKGADDALSSSALRLGMREMRLMRLRCLMTDMLHMSERDRLMLVAHNFPAIMWLCKSAFVDCPDYIDMHLSRSFHSKTKAMSSETDVCDIESKMKQISLKDSSSTREKLDEQVLLHMDKSDVVRQEWPRDSNGEALDETKSILLQLILLISPDLVRVDDPKKVQELRLRYAAMLSRYGKNEGVSSTGSSSVMSSMELAQLMEKQLKM